MNLAFAGLIHAADRYVDGTNGNDSNAGTLAAPYKTIGKAASVINAGETCYIRSGIYREQVTLTRSGNSTSPIRFENYPGETVTLDGTDTPSLTWTKHAGNIYVAAKPANDDPTEAAQSDPGKTLQDS